MGLQIIMINSAYRQSVKG